MSVPSDPGSANWHQNDDPRPQKWSPQASKMPARWSSQPPSQPAEQQPQVRQSAVGGPAAGGVSPLDTPRQALACRRRREATSAQGPNLSRRELWGLRPVPPRQDTAFKNHAFFDMLKKSEKCRKIASQGEPKWSQKSQKSQKNAFRVPLEKQTGKNTRNC